MAKIILQSDLLSEPIEMFAVTVQDLKRRLHDEMKWSVVDVVINGGATKISYTGDSYLIDGDKVKVIARKLDERRK